MPPRRKQVDIYHGHSPSDVPAYMMADAARWIGVPCSTTRGWALGERGYPAVIHIADPEVPSLSFRNLVELHVLAAIRRKHGISLQRTRKAVEFLEEKLGIRSPLATRDMLTDGRDILVEWSGQVLNASEKGQLEFKEVLSTYLQRIEHDRDGTPIRLYPFASLDLAANPAVVIDPRVQFGRPCLRDTGVPTGEIADRHKGGESIASIARDYGRTPEEVEEAIRYELAA